MSNEQTNSNPFLEAIENQFSEAMEKKSEMEKDFSPDLSDDYAANKKKIIELAIEMIKMGVFSSDDTSVYLTVKDVTCELPKSLIKKNMDRTQYDLIFGEEIGEDEKESGESKSGHNEHPNDAEDIYSKAPWYFSGVPFDGKGFMPPFPFYPPLTSYYPEQLNMRESPAKILQSVAELDKRIKALEEREDNSSDNNEEISNLRNLLEKAQASIESYKKNIEELKDALVKTEGESYKKDNEINALTTKLNSATSSLEDKDKKLRNSQDELERIRKNRGDIDSQVDRLKKDNSSLTEQLDSLRKTLNKERETSAQEKQNLILTRNQEIEKAVEKDKKELNQTIENLKNQVKELNSKLESNSNESSDALKQIEEMKKEVTSLKVERDNYKKKIDNLESEKQKLLKDLSDDSEKYRNLKDTSKNLRKLAYTDIKTGVKNLNSFNENFPSYEKNKLILAVVGIRGIKQVNDEFGRQAGDKVIKIVAEELCNAFPKNDIYRILGDQFIICAVDMTLNSVQGQLSDVARKLVYEEIKIVYGTSVGNSCADHYEVLSTAESNMNRMKLQDDTNGGNVDNLYSTVQQATSPIEPKVTKKSDDEPQEVNIEDQIAQFLNM